MTSFETLSLLFFIGLVAGTVDAIAGGGGLLTLPALLLSGLPPVQALATNKIQALASVASSAHRYMRYGVINDQAITIKLIASVAGAAIGAVTVRLIDSDALAKVAPLMLIGIAIFFILSPAAGHRLSQPLISEKVFAFAVALPIGFYDGFFGPGTGSLYAAAFVMLLARDLRSAAGETKVLNAAGSLIAAVIFVSSGAVVWSAAIVMSAGGILGGQIGVHLAVRWGAPLIRLGLVMISIALAVRLLGQQGIGLN